MLQKAIEWIHRNHLQAQAVPVTHRKKIPYPEVTGYYIPTLLTIGEIQLAEQFARWLVSVQNPDGSFSLDNPTISYVFDTGQVIRGWVSIIDRLPELADPLMRACDWIIRGADPLTGRLQFPAPGGDWSLGGRGEVNEAIHLYVLQPMREAAEKLNVPYMHKSVDKALSYYLANCSITNFQMPNALTHFYTYIQEALFELGCFAEVQRGMAAVAAYQQASGAVPGYHDVQWVCSTGLAQLAKVWYLLGDIARADKAMDFLSQLQNASGAFYGSYGVSATYFPTEEISWGVKYCIDAEQLRIARHFDQTAYQYNSTISLQDGRVQAIFSEMAETENVLDVGCGKGRYATLIKQNFPQVEVHAVDISEEMLRCIPAHIHTKKASIQDLPYADASFDLVFCVEALEHALNPEAAIQEMVRVLRPGGRLVIIDKNKARLGALQIESWEKWFDIQELSTYLQSLHLKTRAEWVSYDGHSADGLFVAWVATKSPILTGHNPRLESDHVRASI